jgi:two-component system phosphate regulon sensor histidine kinase PhoR
MAKGYRNTIKALPDAVVVVNDELEIEWSNEIAEQYLGINSKRDLGYRITNLIRVPEFFEYLTSPTTKALEFEAPDTPGMILSLRVIHYGQNQRLILGRDISERVQIRNTLKAFISNASHELRTPLTVTSGYVELIQDDPELPGHLTAPVYQLRKQTDHMTRLIDDLLTLSQLEGDTLAGYEGQTIDLPALLAQYIHTIQQSGIATNHIIELDADDQLGLLGIEREAISIYSNLIENAIKYTPAGSLINVHWGINSEGQPCLTVKDNGPGIGPEHIPQLTQRFYRVHNTASVQTEGTGLGLAIVKHAANHHGGSLSIDSALNAGAEFSVCFPKSRIYKKP